ncbi:hypothetical protein K503DRAFT_711639 [Rhizopogon vinicolor AM-OR11-026]|uniref:Uncharacterized protein n=1 Tax=Rhizopogon vinicolor AM-OR11-026 TaxID=1314800 RepID=A0A1B7NAJ6_9AGAM|nr:hypothetical protein K503DRAFT_711639 [Rhizopogon vinicolor AM-OR11-026]
MSRIVAGIMKFLGPRVTLLIATITLAIFAVGITNQYISDNFSGRVSMSLDNVDGNYDGVVLLANIWNMDMNAQTMSVSWSIIGACGATYTGRIDDSCVANGLSVPMNLYLNLVPAFSWNTSTPTGQYDPSIIQTPLYYIPGRQDIPTFQFDTVMTMDPFLPYTMDKKSSVLYYPFDLFTAYSSVMTINPTDNSTIPIADVKFYGTVVDWIGSGAFYSTVTPPGASSTLYSLALSLERQRAVKAFAMLLVITNWAMSIMVLWMTIKVTFHQKIESGLSLASTTILFAIPQIRASMPNAPPFVDSSELVPHETDGFIDIGGYFINVLIVSICTSVLLFTQLRNSYQPPQTSGQQNPGYRLLPVIGK